MAIAGAAGVLVAGTITLALDTHLAVTGETSIVLAAICGGLASMLAFNLLVARRVCRATARQNEMFDSALESVNQGFCIFDAQDHLVYWNQRYLDLYGIDPQGLWRGCTTEEVRKARRASGTISREYEEYARKRKAGQEKGESFSITTELLDGRVFTIAYQAMRGGGWITMHEDVTARVKAQRELEHTRHFLDW